MRSRNMVEKLQRKMLLKLDHRRFKREFYKKAKLSYPPRQVTIGVSGYCDNKCVFCAYHSEDAGKSGSHTYKIPYLLTLEDFKKMIDMCFEARVPRVHICASGETFFNRDIFEMMDYQIAVYGRVSFQTNFSNRFFNDHNLLDEIVKRGDSVSGITTDVLSGDPDIHNVMKRGSDYESVMSSMEYLSSRTDIQFEVHNIITKNNYQHIGSLIMDLKNRGINCHLALVNLHAYGFNKYTDPEARYLSSDTEIHDKLIEAKMLGKSHGIKVSIPEPADQKNDGCGSFWTRFQVWPVQGVDKERLHENVIVGACDAVVSGKLNTLGYFFDYERLMDLWNNQYFTGIREGLLKGRYPDNKCIGCQNYNEYP